MRHAPRSSLGLALTALLPLLAAPSQAAAPDKEEAARQALKAAEHARAAQLAAQKEAAARAAAAAAKAQELTQARIEAAARLRQAEAATADAAARVDALTAKQREAQARLDARAKAIQPLLPLIERLSLYPAETLLAVPAPPEQTVRGVLVLQGLSRQLEQEAEALRRDQAALDAATKAVQAEQPKLAAAQQAQSAEAAALDQQIAQAQALRQQAEADADAAAKHAADEAAKADNLRSMISSLEAHRKAEAARAREEAAKAEKQKKQAEAEAARQREAALAAPTGAGTLSSGTQAHGQLVAPVVGKVFRAWGEPTDGGPATGISYHTPPAARVVSPCSGRVVFADAFRSYGLLLIVDCGGGYHTVLAGFERLDAHVGQKIEAGEPVGAMPAWQPGSGGDRPSLYLELRHASQPVNPAPWLKSNS